MAHTLSTAAKPEDLDKAYLSAGKALSVLGLKITTKKPNAVILAPEFAKKKKAEFKLDGNAKLIKVSVECGAVTSVLGILDVKAEKDAERSVAIMKSLVECGLATKADLAELQKATAPAPDPKVAANLKREIEALEKTIADAEKLTKAYAAVKDYDILKKIPVMLNAMEAQAAKERSSENLDFIKAAEGTMSRDDLIKKFIGQDAANQINIKSATEKGILDGTTPMKDALEEVKALVMVDTWARALAQRKVDAAAVIAAAQKRLDGFVAMKKKLGIA